ncbi:DUF922 domain-containing protein [Rhodanobacter ginsengiterrae]|uniref:DUF922 domain-containing protein n=1 Tax=Rhodanobacter ginsengiterrae TaxID=2008451 RepID=UPI003CEE1DDF
MLMNGFGRTRFLRFRPALTMVVLAMFWTTAYADEARVVYYDVVGNSATTLRDAMDRQGPLDRAGKRFDGHTTWQLKWSYRYAPVGSECKFTSMSTSLEATIVLPRWVHDERASRSLIKKWDSYVVALRGHEDGHYAHGLAAEKELDALGQSFRVAGACSTIAKAFNDQASAIVARYQALDVTYDRDTDHGKNQGATFP